MTAVLTVSIWHNVTRDPQGRHAGFGGFTPGDQMVKVFTYDLPPGGSRDPPSPRTPSPSATAPPASTAGPPSWLPGTPGDCSGQSRSATWSSSARAPSLLPPPGSRPCAAPSPPSASTSTAPTPSSNPAPATPPGAPAGSRESPARRQHHVQPEQGTAAPDRAPLIPFSGPPAVPARQPRPRGRPPAGSPSRMRRLPRGTCPSCAASWRSGWPGRAPGST
jgi:hypothetical protein